MILKYVVVVEVFMQYVYVEEFCRHGLTYAAMVTMS